MIHVQVCCLITMNLTIVKNKIHFFELKKRCRTHAAPQKKRAAFGRFWGFRSKKWSKIIAKLRLFTVSLAPGTQLSGMTVCRRQFAAFVIFAGTSGKVYTLYRKIAKIMLYITIYFEIPAKCIHFAGILKSVTYNINAFFNSTKIK